jgi:hypothetical protein
MRGHVIALAAAAVISLAALAEFHLQKAFVKPGGNTEDSAGNLRRRIETLEAENGVLSRDLLYMTVKNEAAIGMAEDLLVYTRLSYPMRSEEIIEGMADYQRGLIALLDKLREVK